MATWNRRGDEWKKEMEKLLEAKIEQMRSSAKASAEKWNKEKGILEKKLEAMQGSNNAQ